jgi:hypothetical protein
LPAKSGHRETATHFAYLGRREIATHFAYLGRREIATHFAESGHRETATHFACQIGTQGNCYTFCRIVSAPVPPARDIAQYIAQWLTTKKSAFLTCVGAAGCQRNKNWVTYFGIKMRNFLNRMDTIITTLFDCKIVTINSYKIAQWLTTKKISFSECVA